MKAIFSGYYGAKNSGDDAFVEVSAWGSRKYWQSTEQLFFAGELPQISTPAEHYFAHKNYLSFGKAVKDIVLSDVFVSAGGSTFHSALKKTDLRTYAKLKKSLGCKGKTGAIGISLGPFVNKGAEEDTKEYLKTLDFLALRDDKSYEQALSYNLPYQPVRAFDLAALLPEIYNFDQHTREISEDLPIVGISVCNYESYINGDISKELTRNEFILNLIQQLRKHNNIMFRFFVFNGNSVMGDEKLTQEMIGNLNKDGKLKYEIVPYQPKVQDTFDRIAECSVVISTRLHASIFACYSNTPFFLLEYHRKCTDFLNDVGQAQNYRLLDGNVDAELIVTEIENIIFKKQILVPGNIKETIQRARLNFTATY
ncbi:polysaccharide pyruvyl transferase family protein [Chryseobacterium rhizosphaerae]|jgi:polysaccharide pyruvyl transferase WcaK-like protein|uniref:polysaccharide pyruvyl transferase family protein n=1 Tax=Chryseobacterium rhizosphaerae TaxID=395937 RepID=UPI002358C691|nr:polysaccharide pyruvyl transferase family protein [Chryseobacterium rhizosphaerae]MDC8099702.1 polysaccharide pyruvyl transferase family protein [Chryseobacterium rhizosphaerae]MDR6547374.1 polysaccharide pyruvyl transferase WcaK-like protein [Chryseobacterium rhizosphaerae]